MKRPPKLHPMLLGLVNVGIPVIFSLPGTLQAQTFKMWDGEGMRYPEPEHVPFGKRRAATGGAARRRGRGGGAPPRRGSSSKPLPDRTLPLPHRPRGWGGGLGFRDSDCGGDGGAGVVFGKMCEGRRPVVVRRGILHKVIKILYVLVNKCWCWFSELLFPASLMGHGCVMWRWQSSLELSRQNYA
jgi:hypothetical protein